MAVVTLVQRLIGDGLDDLDPIEFEDPQNHKMSIDAFMRIVRQTLRGAITGPQAITLLDLDAGQTTMASAMIGYVNDAAVTENDRDNRWDFIEDLFYLGENSDFPAFDAAWVMSEWDLRDTRVPVA